MKRKGWIWFIAIQALGIGCAHLSRPAFLRYFGEFLLLPGSLLPFLLQVTGNNVFSQGTVFELLTAVGALVVNALTWRSAARIFQEQGITE